MSVLISVFLSAVLLLFCAGSVGAGTAVLSEGSKELKVVITEDIAQREVEADRLRKAGAFDAAIEIYQGVIAEIRVDERFSPEARLSLKLHYTRKIATSYQAKGEYLRALEHYQILLGAGEESGSQEVVTSALLGMGRLALTFGRSDGVIEVFERHREDLFSELRILLGDLYRKAGRSEEAQQTYLSVLESRLGPRHQGKVVIGCYGVPPEQRAPLEQEALLRARDLRSGLKELAEEGYAQAQRLLGELAWEQGDYPTALIEFQKAEERAFEDPMIRLQVVRTFIALGREQEALKKLTGMRSLLKSSGELLELATTYQLARDPVGARRVLQRLVVEYPDSPEAREAHLRLSLMDKLGL